MDPQAEPETESKLLFLPPEIVTKIISFLPSETLVTLRLTCKTLHDLSLDRFTEEYFSTLWCCISQMDRYQRLREIINGSPRISGRIRWVNFTSSIYEYLGPSRVGTHYVMPQFAPIVPRDSERFGLMVQLANLLYEDTYKGVDIMLVNSVLFQLQGLPQNVDIGYDLREHHAPSQYHNSHHDTALSSTTFCLATTGTRLYAIAICPQNLSQLEYALQYYRSSFMASLASVKCIILDGELDVSESYVKVIFDIFRGTTSMRTLSLINNRTIARESLEGYHARTKGLIPELLRSTDLSNLEKLMLEYEAIDDEDLTTVLECCKSTLMRFTMDVSRLGASDGGWMGIVRTLLTMPRLEYVYWHGLEQYIPLNGGISPKFERTYMIIGGEKCDKMVLDGRERVKSGLHALLEEGFHHTHVVWNTGN